MSSAVQGQSENITDGRGKAGLSMIGALIAGFLASACCTGPLVLIFLGISGAGVLVALEPYRPYFMILTLFFLVGAFYNIYRKPKNIDCANGSCCASRNKRVQKIILWIATLFSLAMLFSPQILLALLD